MCYYLLGSSAVFKSGNSVLHIKLAIKALPKADLEDGFFSRVFFFFFGGLLKV